MYEDVIYICDNDVIKAENIGKRFGWDWGDNNNKYDDILNCGYLIFSINLEKNKKVLFYQLKDRDYKLVMEFLISGNKGNYKITNSLKELKSMLSYYNVCKIDYNSPKKLVYEKSKI